MSFKIVLSDNGLFKDAFEAISTVVDEVACHIDSEGFRVSALDRSHIVSTSLNLKPTVFDEFECSKPEKVTIDTSEFMKVLKRMKGHDSLSLSLEDNNLIIGLSGDVDRTFKIRLIDMEYESQEPPHIEYNVSVEVPSSLFNESIKDMDLFSEKLDIALDEDYLIINTDGEFGDGSVKYLHGCDVSEYVKSCFSIPKLKDIFKASKFSDIVEICLGNDMPVTFNFNLVSDDGSMSFLLAPRLEETD